MPRSDRARRALWTFVQALMGIGAVTSAATASGKLDTDTLVAGTITVVGAAVAALASYVKSWAAEELFRGPPPSDPSI